MSCFFHNAFKGNPKISTKSNTTFVLTSLLTGQKSAKKILFCLLKNCSKAIFVKENWSFPGVNKQKTNLSHLNTSNVLQFVICW